MPYTITAAIHLTAARLGGGGRLQLAAPTMKGKREKARWWNAIYFSSVEMMWLPGEEGLPCVCVCGRGIDIDGRSFRRTIVT